MGSSLLRAIVFRCVVGIAVVGLLGVPAGADPIPPPNVLLIVLDDVRIDGMPVLQARLAGEGVRFDNAFVTDPVCSPSRASLLTGSHAFHHGTRQVGGPIGGADTFRVSGADQQTLAVWLQDAGYRTGLFGKYLNAYGEATEGSAGPGGGFYVPPGWDRWWALVSTEHYGGIHGESYEIVEEDGARTIYADHATDAEYLTDLSAQVARAFMSEAEAAGEPFFVYWSPYASHVETPGLLPAPADRHFGAFAGLPLWRPPSWDEADISDKPRWLGSLPDASVAGAFTDAMRERAYETLLAVDEQIEAFLDHLDALGIGDDTVVFVTSDHGVGWGEHRLFDQLKDCPYEECLRVPLVVRYPRQIGTTPIVRTAPVLNIDVAPTVLALAGAAGPAGPAGSDGESFDGWLFGPQPNGWRTDFLMEYWRPGRDATLWLLGPVTEGDRLRLFHGKTRAIPRASKVFEFDAGDGVSAGAIAVPISQNSLETFSNLRSAVEANVPDTTAILTFGPSAARLGVVDESLDHDGLYWWEELDQADVFTLVYPRTDYFGVRDVANGYTWVESETGERELYDLALDPDQLDNRAADPAYQVVRAQLEARLVALLDAPCRDGVDNDGDGAIDHPGDPGCRDPNWHTESPECDDGLDNDGDGRIDLDDPQCSSAWRLREARRPGCGLGFELLAVAPLLAWLHARRRRALAREAGPHAR